MTLPILTCTEEAESFGRSMTPKQYYRIEGAREALQRAFNAMPTGSYPVLEIKSQVATQIQLYREALESCPHSVLCVIMEREK